MTHSFLDSGENFSIRSLMAGMMGPSTLPPSTIAPFCGARDMQPVDRERELTRWRPRAWQVYGEVAASRKVSQTHQIEEEQRLRLPLAEFCEFWRLQL